ncbi:hypothetical protein HDF16_006115 [Granulicella aggregans]|uniref:Uncharacterized protein n=1 Tax=Granulicella aggregans TaxID=474949 RepID=A0A7W7ZKQ9_9BACT|nr:helicase HerA-like domain-containing protein [Granulicella aggregans]MBB5061379.1 hypothetical protein [Granulicella aggregans]
MTRLLIGKDGFTLPIELVTSTQAILARKRSGKSYTASVQAEELLRHKQQIATIDPTGAWWGLRSSAAGDGPGYPVVVFGGDHADAPLEPHAGRMLATALVEHGFSAIFDVGLMVTEDQIRFTSDFASELLRINRTALHLFIDEADTFAPQLTENRGQKVCLGTVSRLVKQGGVRGVGVTMITQRPADINKKVLSQVDILTVLRMSHPLDIKAATDWIKSEVSVEFAGAVESALPSLPVGSAFFCSASLGIGQRVEVRERETFNSGATPKPGERQRVPKVLAPIDIEQLGREIADSARHAQENSPEFLRQRIADLEREGNRVLPDSSIELAKLQAEISKLKPAAEAAAGYRIKLHEAEEIRKEIFRELLALIAKLEHHGEVQPAPILEMRAPKELPLKFPPRPVVVPRTITEASAADHASDAESPVSTSEQKILDALASLEAVGVIDPSKTQLAAFAGYSNPKSGGFAAPVAALIRKGLAGSSGGKATLTAAGRSVANMPTRPATTNELQARIFHLLGEGERKMLTLLIAAFPESLTRVELAGQAGYSNAKSGGFAAPLARLVELGFVETVRPGVVRGSEMLFLKGKGRRK